MGKIRLLALIIFLVPCLSFSQETMDFATIDSKTLQHYQWGEWKEVVDWGKQGLKAGYDYYYLRARLGVAYFMLDKYLMAIPHFEKSLEFNGESWFSMEYLYYCFLYSGQSNEAEKRKQEFPEALTKKLELEKSKVLKSLYFETGPTFSNNYSENGMRNLMGRQGIYGEQDLYGNNYYTYLGLGFNISKGISWYLGYSNLIIDKRKQIQFPGTIYDIDYNYKVYQNELYTNLIIPAGKGWRVVPAFHLLFDAYSPLRVTYQSIEYSDTSYVDYVGSLGISKQWKWLNIGVSAAYLAIYGVNKQQYGVSCVYYPLGNLNFYGQTAAQVLVKEEESKTVFHQMLGMKIIDRLWLEMFGTFGDMSEMVENNAFVVYNLSDKIKYRLGTIVIIPINEHLELSFRYQFFEKEGYWLQYIENKPGAYRINTITYQTHQILGGLKWIL